jgi:hypothetical protein
MVSDVQRGQGEMGAGPASKRLTASADIVGIVEIRASAGAPVKGEGHRLTGFGESFNG